VALIDIILGPIERLFDHIFGGTVVGRLVTKIRDGIAHILTLVQRIEHLISSIKSEVHQFSTWKEDLQIKSRVISIPAAVEHTQDLLQGAKDAWQAILDLIKDFKEKTTGGDPKAEAEEMASDLEGGAGESLLKRLPKLGKGLEKLLGVVTLIVDSIISWSDAVDKLQTIVDEVTRIREAIEHGDLIFLKNRNPRRVVKLQDGTTMKIRIGNLHS
jgi:hypothetical protein